MADLTQTQLVANLTETDRQIALPSTVTGIAKGDVLYFDGEAVRAVTAPVLGIVPVTRGVYGTVARPHAAGVLVFAGSPTQFYSDDPKGAPLAFPPANPYINMPSGRVWFAVGDQVGPGALARVWQLQVSAPSVGALGVRSTPPVGTPSASS